MGGDKPEQPPPKRSRTASAANPTNTLPTSASVPPPVQAEVSAPPSAKAEATAGAPVCRMWIRRGVHAVQPCLPACRAYLAATGSRWRVEGWAFRVWGHFGQIGRLL